jgi:hypothetical protein
MRKAGLPRNGRCVVGVSSGRYASEFLKPAACHSSAIKRASLEAGESRRRGKHGKNSTITTSRALNKPPPMALKTCEAMTTTALRAERWVRATFPPLDVDAKAQGAGVSN